MKMHNNMGRWSHSVLPRRSVLLFLPCHLSLVTCHLSPVTRHPEMLPEQLVQLNALTDIRDAARKYMDDNIGWRAEDRDLVWSYRYVAAKLSLLHGQTMTFGELTQTVATVLSETSSPLVRQLTPELIAKKLCTPLPTPEPAVPDTQSEQLERPDQPSDPLSQEPLQDPE